jgi:hypothetical protein
MCGTPSPTAGAAGITPDLLSEVSDFADHAWDWAINAKAFVLPQAKNTPVDLGLTF